MSYKPNFTHNGFEIDRDTVRVIRCRDCRYYRASRSINGVTITECLYALTHGEYAVTIWTEPNGYCHRAIKRRVE